MHGVVFSYEKRQSTAQSIKDTTFTTSLLLINIRYISGKPTFCNNKIRRELLNKCSFEKKGAFSWKSHFNIVELFPFRAE